MYVGKDFEAAFTETFTLVGSEQKVFIVPVTDDNVSEGPEMFSVSLIIVDDGLIEGLRLGQNTAVAIINDNDGMSQHMLDRAMKILPYV